MQQYIQNASKTAVIKYIHYISQTLSDSQRTSLKALSESLVSTQ